VNLQYVAVVHVEKIIEPRRVDGRGGSSHPVAPSELRTAEPRAIRAF
jgi:hypothetical protein